MGLLMALDGTVGASRAVQRENEIRAQLESRLARLSVGPLEELKDEGEFDGTLYEAEVSREEISNDEQTLLDGFWRIRVVANWREAGAEQEWAVSHLVYQP